jgi:hypothetical protein
VSAGLEPGDPIVFIRNRPERRRDPKATVFSEELGIVQTGSLPGRVVNAKGAEAIPAEDSSAYFVPGPVRVLFGATRRPRTDQALTDDVTVSRNEAPGNKLNDNGDAQTYFTRAFQRAEDETGTPVIVPLSMIPVGEGQAVSRPDLVELIPLQQEVEDTLAGGVKRKRLAGQTGNKAVLESDAILAAQAIFSRPKRVSTQRATVSRPLSVNCDGVVDSVEVRMNPGGIGFTTVILTGGEATRDPNPFRTRARPARMTRKGDDADREGITK